MSLTKVSFSMIQGPIFSVLDFNVSTSASASTNTSGINAALTAAENAGGGVVFIPPGTYTIAGNIGASTTEKICLMAYGAVLQQQSVNAQYNMFSPGSNMTIVGLTIRGYVAAGTDHTNVQPPWSFGFRVDGSQQNVRFIECGAENIPYDGWYISGTAKNIYLEDCTGSIVDECYRNTVAIAPSGGGSVVNNAVIIGGKFGKAKLRPAIDIEPDSGGSLVYSSIGGGVTVTGPVDVIAGPNHVKLDGITFDGSDAYLNGNIINFFEVNNLEFINGAYLDNLVGRSQFIGTGADVTSCDLRIGLIGGLGSDIGPNLILGSYNTFANWSIFNSGTGSNTVTPNTPIGPYSGLKIECVGNALVASQVIAVEAEEYYSVGGWHNTIAGGFANVVVTELNAGGSSLTQRVFRGNANNGKFAGVFKTEANTVSISIAFGSSSTSATQSAIFGPMYLRKGITDQWVPNAKETIGPVWEAAPTTGTWKQGDIVIDNTPSAGGTLGWVCTSAGTPGTWKTFGAITA